MASRDPFVDGNLMAFDSILAQENDADAALNAMMGADGMELVDQDMAAAGVYGQQTQQATTAARAIMALTSLGDLLSELRRDSVDARWAQDENTLLNFAFKNGHHYVEVDRARRGVVALPAPRNHVRRKVAKFEPWYRAQHGQLSAQAPMAGIKPKTRQQEDRDAASFAEELKEWMEPRIFGFQQRSQNTMWMMLGGTSTAYVGPVWEPDQEYELMTGIPHKPDLEITFHSPMEIWTDNTQSCVKDLRWIGRDLFVPEPEARAMYLDREQQDHLTTESEVADPNEHGFWTLRVLQNMLGREDPWGRYTSRQRLHHMMEEEDVIISEFWGRRNLVLQGAFLDGLEQLDEEVTVEVLDDGSDGRAPLVRFPNGVRIRFTPEGHILEIIDNYIPKGNLPFREFKLSQSAGFWTMAWATPLREINQTFDWVISLREEHLLRTANPIFLEPKDARVKRRQTASGTTVRVRYKANRFNVKPEWANPPTMPADIVQFLAMLNELWMEIGGRREVSQGALPARLSGVAVSLLQEADAAQLGFAGNELEDGYKDILTMALRCIQEFFPEEDPRLLQLAGNAPFKLQAFMAADLEDGLDITVAKGTGVPRSATVVKQTAMELFQAGALLDERGLPDYRRLMRIFEFGSDDELYAEDEMDRQNAMDEEEAILGIDPVLAAMLLEQAMTTGILPAPFEVSAYDNHVVHERSHRQRLKKIEGDQRIHPLNKKLLEFHWTLTVQGALPVLIQTDPTIAAAFMPQPAPEEGEEGGEDEGGDEEAA